MLTRSNRLVAVLRFLIAFVFLYAGMAKLRAVEEFRLHILEYRIVPAQWAAFVASSLPFYEAIAGFWLLLGWRRRVPVLAVLLMSAVFTLATAQALARNLDIECGCFGGAVRSSGRLWMSLALDWLLLLGGSIVYRAAYSESHS